MSEFMLFPKPLSHIARFRSCHEDMSFIDSVIDFPLAGEVSAKNIHVFLNSMNFGVGLAVVYLSLFYCYAVA